MARVNLIGGPPVPALIRRLRHGDPIVTDGGTGTELLRRTGSSDTETARERLDVHDVHRDFVAAGAQIVVASTFTIARDLVQKTSVVPLAVHQMVAAAREARPRFVALSLGPGGTAKTYRDVTNDIAVASRVTERVRIDAVFVETMTSTREADAAMKAAARLDVPILVTFAVDADGVGYGGLSVKQIAEWARGAKPDAVGFNCGVGPQPVLEAGRRLGDLVALPLVLRPAASAPGHPDATPRVFAEFAREAISCGARVIGGCCGAGPDHIRELSRALVDAIALG